MLTLRAMADEQNFLSTADKIANLGDQIYAEKYRAKCEQNSPGQYIAIDTKTGKAYVRQFPELALEAGRTDAPFGVFHLIRIGSPGAFKTSRRSHSLRLRLRCRLPAPWNVVGWRRRVQQRPQVAL